MEKRNVEGLLDALGAQIACFQGERLLAFIYTLVF